MLETNNGSKPEIKFNIPVDEFDDFEFKILDKGLGFHHNEKREVPLKQNKVTTKPRVQTTPKENIVLNKNIFNAIYNNEGEETAAPKKKVVFEASVFKLAQSWAIDIFFISLFSIGTLGILLLVSGLNIENLINRIGLLDISIFAGSIFVIFYLTYFTALDTHLTPGKDILNIKLVNKNGKSAKASQAFLRALVSLVSIALLGVPFALDLSGKISATKVIENG